MAYTKQNFEDGQVLNAEHLNKMEEGIAAPDWDQMVNRPFGDVLTTLYEGTNLEPELSDGAYMLSETVDFSFVEGNQYTVVIDGVEYVSDVSMVFGLMPVIGNPVVVGGEDNGQTFAGFVDGGTFSFVSFNNFNTLSISTVLPKKIDERYLYTEPVIWIAWSDGYLYVGNASDINNRLTLSQLKSVYDHGRRIHVSLNNALCTPIIVDTRGDYGDVAIIGDAAEFSLKRYKTAEYTAS